jgi:hypothetical protein
MTEGTELKLVTFDRTSARDVVQKLRREIERIEIAADCDLARDQVINAFWTAWHLHEWLWSAVSERPELKAAVLKYRGIDEAGINDQKALGAALAGRFVPLKICRVIATSSKLVQVVLQSESDARTLSPDVAGIGEGPNGEMQALSALASTPARCMPMIVVMGRPVVATRILKELEDYWVTLIQECGIEQLQ